MSPAWCAVGLVLIFWGLFGISYILLDTYFPKENPK